MTISNIQPIYPNGIFPWSDKVDNSDIDFAIDINSTVADLESVETTLGTNPQVERGVPTGLPVSYSTLSARVTDAMTNNQMPYSSLLATSIAVPNTNSGSLISFRANLDSYGCYNGTDITIPANGWWDITSSAQWGWQDTGYSHHYLTLNGNSNVLDQQILDWEFSGNVTATQYSPTGGIINQPSGLIPRFYLYGGQRRVRTRSIFQGPLHAGDRLSVYLENGTSNATATVYSASLKSQMIRVIPPSVTFTSG